MVTVVSPRPSLNYVWRSIGFQEERVVVIADASTLDNDVSLMVIMHVKHLAFWSLKMSWDF